MERYDSYKDSGIIWVGQTPQHWSEQKIQFLFTEKKSTPNISLNCGSISFGKVVFKDDDSIPSSRKETYQEVLDGEFLVNPLNLNYDLKSLRIARSDKDVVVSPGYMVLQLQGHSDPRFFEFLLHMFDTEHMKSLGSGVRQTISFNHLKTERLPIPPINEQRMIGQYLDRKTALIDSLIEKTVRKIELLREKRTALINHVVTKGLNPDVEMKDSGVEWIGEIPSHWEMTPLKRVVKIGNGKDYKHLEVEFGGFPVFGTGGEFARCSDYLHSGPSVLLGRKGTIDNPLFVTEPFWTSDTIYYTVICEDKIQPKLLFHLVRLIPFSLFSYGSAIPSMTKTDYLEMRFPLPPLHEQERIVEYLDEQTSIIDSTIATEERRIELLKEYRQSLISEVVTGKVKVTRDE